MHGKSVKQCKIICHNTEKKVAAARIQSSMEGNGATLVFRWTEKIETLLRLD